MTVSPGSLTTVGVIAQGGAVRGYSGRYHAIRVPFDFFDSAMVPSPCVANMREGQGESEVPSGRMGGFRWPAWPRWHIGMG